MRYDNTRGAISLAPDGTAYVGVLNGPVRVRDTPWDGVQAQREDSAM